MAVWTDVALTHTGNVRTNNEDAFACHPELGLWLVADGMGGHEAGEVASAIAINTISQQFCKGCDLSSAIQQAHQDILSASHQGQGAHGMGTTVVALQANHQKYQIAWVGDSRAYLWTRTGEATGSLEQLTTDHSYVQMLVKAGTITQQESESHPERNVIMQCLGFLSTELPSVDSIEREWQDGQWILLCSDGLTDELTVEQISATLAQHHEPKYAAQSLLEQALAQGGRDNITLAIVTPQANNKSSLWKQWLGKIQR